MALGRWKIFPFVLMAVFLVASFFFPCETDSELVLPALTKASALAAAGDDFQDFVDTISNLHTPSDIGTHSSFAEMQDKDGTYDTLTEADTDTGTSTFGDSSGSGTLYRTTAANEVRLGVYTASSNGEVASIVFYGRGSSSTYAKAIITSSTGYLLANGVGAATAVSTTAGTKTLTYSAGSRPIVTSGTTYWIGLISQAAIRIYYDSTTGGTSRQDTSNNYGTPTDPTDAGSTTENWRRMYANINNINYGVDLEVGWTTADYDEENEELCIYGGTQNAEALKVDVWSGSWTNVISDIAAGWNNVSVSSYLTSSAFEIRFVDARDTPDASSASTWQVEGVLLHVWTVESGVSLNVTVYQTLEVSESASTTVSLVHTANEEIAIDETPVTVVSVVLSIFQSVLIVGVVSTKVTLSTAIFESVLIVGVVTTKVTFGLILSETFFIGSSVTVNIISGIQYLISIFEAINIQSVASTILNAVVAVSENINILDLITAEINPPIRLTVYEVITIIGVETMIQSFNIFYELFLSLQMWGYTGPMLLVIIGYFLSKKNTVLGILWFVVECLFIAQYLTLVAATPQYWWHIFLLLFGGLATCAYPLWDR